VPVGISVATVVDIVPPTGRKLLTVRRNVG
jgi:hypothetical protein